MSVLYTEVSLLQRVCCRKWVVSTIQRCPYREVSLSTDNVHIHMYVHTPVHAYIDVHAHTPAFIYIYVDTSTYMYTYQPFYHCHHHIVTRLSQHCNMVVTTLWQPWQHKAAQRQHNSTCHTPYQYSYMVAHVGSACYVGAVRGAVLYMCSCCTPIPHPQPS